MPPAEALQETLFCDSLQLNRSILLRLPMEMISLASFNNIEVELNDKVVQIGQVSRADQLRSAHRKANLC